MNEMHYTLLGMFLIGGLGIIGTGSLFATDTGVNLGFFDAGLGFLSVSFGLIALGLAHKSDHVMRSIANLEFAEKGALISLHEGPFKDGFLAGAYQRVSWNLLAITAIAQWTPGEQNEGHFTLHSRCIRHSDLQHEPDPEPEARRELLKDWSKYE